MSALRLRFWNWVYERGSKLQDWALNHIIPMSDIEYPCVDFHEDCQVCDEEFAEAVGQFE